VDSRPVFTLSTSAGPGSQRNISRGLSAHAAVALSAAAADGLLTLSPIPSPWGVRRRRWGADVRQADARGEVTGAVT
jgi:hypothetical protein